MQNEFFVINVAMRGNNFNMFQLSLLRSKTSSYQSTEQYIQNQYIHLTE